jgi:TonB family protein
MVFGRGWQIHCKSDGIMATPNTTSLGLTENERFQSVRPTSRDLFVPPEPKKSRGWVFLASVGIHAVMLAALLIVPLFLIAPVRPREYDVTLLLPPAPRQVIEMPQLQAPPAVKPKPVNAPPRPNAPVRPVQPKEIKIPELKVDPKPIPEGLRAEAVLPKPPVVRTEVFSQPAEIRSAPVAEPVVRQVQVGAFGDSKAALTAQTDKTATTLGSFGDGTDRPASSGSKSMRGVTGAGFDDVKTVSASGGGRKPAAAIDSAFTSYRPTASQVRRREAEPVQQIPVEIIYKPRPEYTESARRLRIEGEVVLRVVFPASGSVQVLDVVRGLGHGLDESAIRAAQQIQFRPASRQGTPTDFTATIRVAFQLAY